MSFADEFRATPVDVKKDTGAPMAPRINKEKCDRAIADIKDGLMRSKREGLITQNPVSGIVASLGIEHRYHQRAGVYFLPCSQGEIRTSASILHRKYWSAYAIGAHLSRNRVLGQKADFTSEELAIVKQALADLGFVYVSVEKLTTQFDNELKNPWTRTIEKDEVLYITIGY